MRVYYDENAAVCVQDAVTSRAVNAVHLAQYVHSRTNIREKPEVQQNKSINAFNGANLI